MVKPSCSKAFIVEFDGVMRRISVVAALVALDLILQALMMCRLCSMASSLMSSTSKECVKSTEDATKVRTLSGRWVRC